MSDQPEDEPTTSVSVDAVGGCVVITLKRGEVSAPLSMEFAHARELASVIATRADQAYVQWLELQLSATRRELEELRKLAAASESSPS